jgi:hypothetical protein
MRSLLPKKPDRSGGLVANRTFAPTRRGLIAALAAASTVAGVQAAKASAILPDWIRKKGGGKGGGGTCFLRGTRIRTPRGEVEVEALSIGDMVETVSGGAKPIKGVRRWRFERQADGGWARGILPVKVARSALGPETPHSDLFISEAHALYLDGLLIPVRLLINGRSIVKCASIDADAIEYFHIELFAHDVLLAEGAPAETFQDRGGHEFGDWAAKGGMARTEPLDSRPFAPVLPFNYRTVVRSRLRTALSPLVDRRQPVDIVWERLAERAETQIAA